MPVEPAVPAEVRLTGMTWEHMESSKRCNFPFFTWTARGY